jgi:hypothetical protein
MFLKILYTILCIEVIVLTSILAIHFGMFISVQ